MNWTKHHLARPILGARGSRGRLVIAVGALALLCGCANPRPNASATDSTGTIAGRLRGESAGGNPFYGSVVYLIPVTPSSEDWWEGLARPRYALIDPQHDRSLGFSDRTTCAPQGQFLFSAAQPGDYFLYARVLWAGVVKASSGVDSTIFAGEAWIGRATVAAGETTRSELQSRRTAFQAGKPVRKSIRPDRPTDPDLPRFGDYVYVEELPEVVSRVQPDYPTDMRESGTVMVGALVGKDGRVMDTRIVKSIPPLDSAALAAVRQWIFKPALVNQRPTAVWVSVPVKFSP